MYYELGQASMMESFRKTNWRLLVVNYFRKNAPVSESKISIVFNGTTVAAIFMENLL